MKRTVIARVIPAMGMSVAVLVMMAGTAGATKTLTPASVDFGDRQVGTASVAQQFTLNVRCSAWLPEVPPFIPGVCVLPDPFLPVISLDPPGEFTETNDCPALMPGDTELGTSCTIDAAFTPTSTGPKQATLLTGPLGPTASLSGVGVESPTPPGSPIPGPAPPDGDPPPTGVESGSLTLNLAAKRQKLRKRVALTAAVRVVGSAHSAGTHAVTLVVGGKAIRRTTRRLVVGKRTTVRARFKRAARKRLARRIDRRGTARTRIVGAAVDESGRAARGRVRVRFRR
jgi:hypothetical protein